jgi:hypothetical protein
MAATHWRFNDDQRSDLTQAAALAEKIDPTGADDVLFGLWRLSLAFMVEHWPRSSLLPRRFSSDTG